MNRPGIYLILGDDRVTAGEEDMPELALSMQSLEIARLEMHEIL